jgi:hypothetical protein
MKSIIKMPVPVYFGFLGRLTVESREYVVLKTAVIESHAPDDIVNILCDEADRVLLLNRAKEFYADAVGYIQRALDA